MVDKQVAMVIKIEYEIEDNRDRVWSAYIMAYSQDEAIRYLAKFLKKTIKVSSVGIEAPRVDGLSEEVRSGITGKPTKAAVKAEKKLKAKKKADVEPSPEELEKLQKAREKALEDLKAQGVVDIYEPSMEKTKEEETEKVVTPPKVTKSKKPLNIKLKK